MDLDHFVMNWQDRAWNLMHFSFGFGAPGDSMMGSWLISFAVQDSNTTSGKLYFFNQTDTPATENVDLSFFDPVNNAGGECVVRGEIAGICTIVDLDKAYLL